MKPTGKTNIAGAVATLMTYLLGQAFVTENPELFAVLNGAVVYGLTYLAGFKWA